MKIYIILLNANSIGGIEKVAKNLFSILNEFSVEVIDLIELKKRYGNYSELKLCCKFLNDMDENDIILSLYDRLSIMLLFASIIYISKVKIIACQHADFYANKIHTRMLRRFLYKKANHVIALTKADRDLYIESGLHNVSVIPNPITNYPDSVPSHSSRENNVIAAGRLNKIKAFENVIDLAVIMSEIESVNISIYGDGEEMESLAAYTKKLGLEPDKILHGSTTFLDDIFVSSKFLVVTSQRESFSMVILEAMASGCIPISFDCPTGPRELIENGNNGFLVPMGDVFGIKRIIEMLLNDPNLAEVISMRARAKAAHYRKSNILRMWGNVINEL
ncbi:glycosyltransferase [Aeromonas veronii]